MTTIIAAEAYNGFYVAADKTVFSGRQRLNCEHKKLMKICIGEDTMAIIGVVGSKVHLQKLEQLYIDNNQLFNFTKAELIPALFEEIRKQLTKNYGLIPIDDDFENQQYESIHMDGLIVSKAGIFEFDAYGCITDISHYHAIGSGSEFALGAMHSLYDFQTVSIEESVERAMHAAHKFDAYTGKDFDIEFVSKFY